MKIFKITTEYNIYLRTNNSSSIIEENGQEIDWRGEDPEYYDGLKMFKVGVEEITLCPAETEYKVMTFTGKDNLNYSVLIKDNKILIPSAFKAEIEDRKQGYTFLTCFEFYCDICNSVAAEYIDKGELSVLTEEDLNKIVGIEDKKIMTLQQFADSVVSYVSLPFFFLKKGIFHETFRKSQK